MEPIATGTGPCRVIGAAKLPAASGGADALCSAIEHAVSTASPSAGYSVEVQVLSPSSLAATIRTGDGRVLPVQKMAVSDAKLTKGSIERFARAIAMALAQAGER
ncbi:MAG: hypothetical protein M3Q57_06155 [Pseudomonadota bacterium]|nr:hypothetical protein [Pseudomonadota bacterium]